MHEHVTDPYVRRAKHEGYRSRAAYKLIEVLDNLTLKSLLSQEQGGGVTRYRFLNTTRTYALEKLEHSGELRALETRYAGYVSQTSRPSGGQVALQLVE